MRRGESRLTAEVAEPGETLSAEEAAALEEAWAAAEVVARTEPRAMRQVEERPDGRQRASVVMGRASLGGTRPSEQRLNLLTEAVWLMPKGSGGRQRRERRFEQQQRDRAEVESLMLQAQSRMAAAIGRGAAWPTVVEARLEARRAQWLESRAGAAAYVGEEQAERRFMEAARAARVEVGMAR